MGFSQNKQYSPNGNVCSRKVVNVFNTLASSIPTGGGGGGHNGNTILNHIRSWQRSRRLRALNKSNNNAFDQLTPMNNLCYQSMPSKSMSKLNYYKSTSDLLTKQQQQPVVSFRNKGEGMIALQLIDRVMLNENQLYSLNLHGPKRPETCYMSLDGALSTPAAVAEQSLCNELWFHGSINRERAIALLHSCPIGSFVVRNSCTKENCYALTVRVPHDYNHIGIAHYLILHTEAGLFKIKGFQKEFCTVSSLITHHSIMKEQLPCTLLLHAGNQALAIYKSVSCSQLASNGNKCVPLYSPSPLPPPPTVSPLAPESHKPWTNNIYNTYAKSSTGLVVDGGQQEELMVDVDTDPTYQKILDNFRKAMAHCS